MLYHLRGLFFVDYLYLASKTRAPLKIEADP